MCVCVCVFVCVCVCVCARWRRPQSGTGCFMRHHLTTGSHDPLLSLSLSHTHTHTHTYTHAPPGHCRHQPAACVELPRVRVQRGHAAPAVPHWRQPLPQAGALQHTVGGAGGAGAEGEGWRGRGEGWRGKGPRERAEGGFSIGGWGYMPAHCFPDIWEERIWRGPAAGSRGAALWLTGLGAADK